MIEAAGKKCGVKMSGSEWSKMPSRSETLLQAHVLRHATEVPLDLVAILGSPTPTSLARGPVSTTCPGLCAACMDQASRVARAVAQVVADRGGVAAEVQATLDLMGMPHAPGAFVDADPNETMARWVIDAYVVATLRALNAVLGGALRPGRVPPSIVVLSAEEAWKSGALPNNNPDYVVSVLPRAPASSGTATPTAAGAATPPSNARKRGATAGITPSRSGRGRGRGVAEPPEPGRSVLAPPDNASLGEAAAAQAGNSSSGAPGAGDAVDGELVYDGAISAAAALPADGSGSLRCVGGCEDFFLPLN